VTGAPTKGGSIRRRDLQTLLAYGQTGSHKAAAHRLAISESTSRQRVSTLCRRLGAGNAAQAVWLLRALLEEEEELLAGRSPG
jgi:Bacterial regulatory helix-turn-helix protein, lysR family.